jgi:hypothetical protein
MELKKIFHKLESFSVTTTHHVFLGGSYVLKHVYDVLKRETEDIDIIIYGFSQRQLDWIRENFDIHYKSESYGPTTTADRDKDIFYIQALHKGKAVFINFITYKHFLYINSYAKYDNDLSVIPLKAILDAKLQYNRPKDKADLLDIMMELNTPRETHLPIGLKTK